jgi:hypothetical protein
MQNVIASLLDDSLRCSRDGGSASIVLISIEGMVCALEAVDVPEPGLEEGADEVGEAVS